MMNRRVKQIGVLLLSGTLLSGCGSSMKTAAPMEECKAESARSEDYSAPALENAPVSDSEDISITLEEDSMLDEQMPFNTEEYSPIVENNFKAVYNEPLSTFSIDVDTASYSNMRRMLEQGLEVNKDAVRIEEMLNYFNYNYKEPEGDAPFSVTTEIGDCPWNMDTKLLSIGLQAKNIDYRALPPSNLVFLIDVSGSMDEPNKLPLVQQAFMMLTENLKDEDTISIVTYAGDDTIALRGATGKDKAKITNTIEELMAGGGTHGSKGIETAYELAAKYYIPNGNNRVILATDGDLNIGLTSEGELKRLIEEEREKGIFLSVLGFGSENLKNNKMETLADNGNGNYAYIDSRLEAKKVLVEERGGTLFTVAKDVKMQLEFNPAQIKGYRLIGYENRLLNTEDFNDDKKDAGEIGAGHSVTALYEIVPVDSEMEIPGVDLKYQNNKVGESNREWLTLKLRYKEPNGDESKLLTTVVDKTAYRQLPSDNLRFASGVAAFGLLLRDSEYKGNATYHQIYKELKEIPILKEDMYKQEFLDLVKLQMKRTD